MWFCTTWNNDEYQWQNTKCQKENEKNGRASRNDFTHCLKEILQHSQSGDMITRVCLGRGVKQLWVAVPFD